ncbi:MAG TPA: hypothetical protein VFX18_00165 [Candidatus Nitrosocosmicus sp.]|nr:hypothetical protein [Candidatus Nitrosocosmicus sp.]
MKQRFSIGSKCECNCHGRTGTIEFCGYCTNSHRNTFFNKNRTKSGQQQTIIKASL